MAVDGLATGGRGMTFNFVGSRYEMIGSATTAGHFTVSGSTVHMVGEDGAPFGSGNWRYSIQGNRLTLQDGGSSFVLERAHR